MGLDGEGGDGEGGNRKGEMEMGEMGRGRWGGDNRKTGKLAKGRSRRRGKRRGDFTYEMLGWTYGMPGWNEVTEFFYFVYPCNAGYPS